VQPGVDRVGARLAHESQEPDAVLAAALGARSMARGERGGVVEEESPV